MKPAAVILLIALAASACSPNDAETTTSTSAVEPTAGDTGTTTTVTEASTTSSTIPAGEATFAIGEVKFGEAGWVEIVNLGPDPGDPGGHWIAMHPFYLELPSVVIEAGDSIALTFGNRAPPGVENVFPVNETLPVLSSDSGEIGLYADGDFGDPFSIVDYLEWNRTPHFRNPVAVAARIWPAESFIAVPAAMVAIAPTRLPTFGPDDWGPADEATRS